MNRPSVLGGFATVLLALLLFPTRGQCGIILVNTSRSLQQHLCNHKTQVQSNAVLKLVSSSLQLDTSDLCLLSDKVNISIIGMKAQPAVITCSKSGGLGFVNISTLNIRNVKIQNCGAEILPLNINITSGPYLANTFHASLAIVESSNVLLSKVVVTGYYGYAILAMNVYGVSVMSDITVTEATGLITNGIGSGLMVYYHDSVGSTASLSIVNAQLVLNHLFTNQPCLPELLYPLSHSTPIPAPYASALSVVYNQVNHNISVTIAKSNISYNAGCPVVGMLVLYFDSSSSVTTMITNDTVIRSNHIVVSQCKCRGTGFAMVTFFSPNYIQNFKHHYDFSSNWTPMSISDSQISHHTGADINTPTQSFSANSGAVYLTTSQIDGMMVHVAFHNVSFNNNNAFDAGTCLYAETMATISGNTRSLVVHLNDVTVNGNTHNEIYSQYSPGAILTFVNNAAVYITSSEQGKSVFTHNLGSVIEMYNTDLYMSGNVSFEHNKAEKGAAMKLLDGSHLFMHTNLSAVFQDNNASTYGGAIYGLNDRLDNFCTFQVLSSNLTEVINHSPLLHFKNNTANLVGKSVYASRVYDCQQSYLIQLTNISFLYSKIFLFESQDTSTYSQSLSSTPARIVSCQDGKPLMDKDNTELQNTLSSYPGKKFNISLAALDGGQNTVYTTVQLQFYRSEDSNHKLLTASTWKLSSGEEEQVLNGTAPCTNVTLTIHTKLDDKSCNDLSTGYCIGTAYFAVPDSTPTFRAKIKLNYCPSGFQLTDDTGVCECSSLVNEMNQNFKLNLTCDIQKGVVKVPYSGTWIGCYNNSNQSCEVGISSSCFPGFCNYSSMEWMSSSADICIETREGALCGSCAGNNSVVFGSNLCYSCSNWWLVTLAFYALAGILFIALLFSLKLTISAGTINGVIFFANMWNTGLLEILSYKDDSVWVAVNRIFISLINLGLGFPLCFYDGMTELTKSWLQLVFPVYLLALVVLLVIVSRYSMRVSRLVYSSAVPVLVTVVHLSFSRLLLSVIDAFSLGQIHTDNSGVKQVWLRDGSVAYFDLQHGALMIVSLILAAVFILPYLILLLGARWWIKIPTVSLYLKPILDAAHGPFKENRQYWFALRLILLVQQLIVYAGLRGNQELLLYSVNAPILIVFTVLHVSAWPFKSKAVCVLDGAMMVVLCLVYACTDYSQAVHNSTTTVYIASSWVTLILVVTIGILIYHSVIAVLSCCSTRLPHGKKLRSLASLPGTLGSYHNDEDTPQLREPLLDSSYDST